MSGLARFSLLFLVIMVSGCADTPTGDMPARASDQIGVDADESADVDVQREFERATDLMKQGEYRRGLEVLDTLLRNREARKNAALHINRGIAYEKLGRTEQAEEAFKAALAIESDHPVANNEYGMMLRRAGRFQEARAAYEKAIANHPEFLPARRNLGILCDLYLGDLGCAMEQYQAYGEAYPDDKTVATWIADLQQKIGRREAAAP